MARFEMMEGDLASLGASGNPDVLFELGIMYSTGRTGVVDLVTAHKWFNIAALRGCVEARARRQEVAEQMSRAEIAEAQKAAREWITLH